MAPLTIAPRFCGPPASGHGGYTAGVVAAVLGPGPATVRLRRPPPLGRPLELVETAEGAALLDDGTTIATAVPEAGLDVVAPAPVPVEVATACEHRFGWRHDHPFPTCFGCGTARAPGDGWRTFGGEVPGGGAVASGARAPADLLDADGGLPLGQRWAVLDCITAAAGALVGLPRDPPWLLGSLTVASSGEVDGRRPMVVMAWPGALEGRKFTAEAALVADGEVVGRSRARWIQLRVTPPQ